MKTLLVDDEIKAIEMLEYYLTDFFNDFEIVGKCSNISEALELINNQELDIIFLDVNMPNGSGLELMEIIKGKNIKIVLVTAHDKYAVDAIKLDVFDYLLKPINISELNRVHQKIIDFDNSTQIIGGDNKIIVKISSNHFVFDKSEIMYIESSGNYSTVHAVGRKPLVISKNLKKVESQYFNQLPFFRAFQSNIININHVRSFSNQEVTMTDGKKLSVSQKNAPKLISLIINGAN